MTRMDELEENEVEIIVIKKKGIMRNETMIKKKKKQTEVCRRSGYRRAAVEGRRDGEGLHYWCK